MEKPPEGWADARKSIRKTIENKKWTYCSSFMSNTWLALLFWFFYFLIRNFNSFFSYFYYCNWRKNSHHHAYSRHHANQEWLIFPTTTLISGIMSIREGRVSSTLYIILIFFSCNGSILDKTSRTVTGPKQDVSGY